MRRAERLRGGENEEGEKKLEVGREIEAESEGGPGEKLFQLSRRERQFISISCFETRTRISLAQEFLSQEEEEVERADGGEEQREGQGEEQWEAEGSEGEEELGGERI